MEEDEYANGYRVVWFPGYWIDHATYDEAHAMFCALESLPAFRDELFRPRIVKIRDGRLDLDAVFPDWPTRDEPRPDSRPG